MKNRIQLKIGEYQKGAATMEPLCDVLEEEYIDRYGEDWTGACVFHIGERGRTEYLDLKIGKTVPCHGKGRKSQ